MAGEHRTEGVGRELKELAKGRRKDRRRGRANQEVGLSCRAGGQKVMGGDVGRKKATGVGTSGSGDLREEDVRESACCRLPSTLRWKGVALGGAEMLEVRPSAACGAAMINRP
ncbi:unnamed protein product [Prunus armeniaca]|uniref:Uncharacterized protein n=1 Tax=Prunus armeniaca TaxID=36596 RepID=A0A6J5XZ53_PRUAR|nr:unnamed protein product [Prunus armeniaca]